MSKKTETIELRVSPELKAQLSEACKRRNQPMSGLIRQLVEAELSDFAPETPQSGVGNLARSGTQRMREFGFAGVSLVALALGWTLATQTPVAAQMAVRVTFAEMDRNEDGTITRDEYRRFMEADFAPDMEEAGDNGDQKVPEACEAEFTAFETEDIAEAATEEFMEYDANGDGRLVYDELSAAMIEEREEEFAELDSNSDGFLARAEFDVMMTDLSDGADGLSVACVQALTALDAEALAIGADDLRLAFVAIDENRDNQISRKEYLNN